MRGGAFDRTVAADAGDDQGVGQIFGAGDELELARQWPECGGVERRRAFQPAGIEIVLKLRADAADDDLGALFAVHPAAA